MAKLIDTNGLKAAIAKIKAMVTFTSLTSSASTNLSVTVNGQKKSVADLYATYADRLRTARTLWGQSFTGAGNVSGVISNATAISLNPSIDSDYWSDGRNKHPWYGLDMRYNNTGNYSLCLSNYYGMTFKVSTGEVNIKNDGVLYANNGLRIKNEPTSYIGMATVKGCLSLPNNASRTSIAPLYRMNDADGNCVAFGSIMHSIGFNGLRASDIKTGTNARLFYTEWDMTNGTLTHSEKFVCKSLSQTSDLRLKEVKGNISLTVDEIASAPVIRFDWKDGKGSGVGSTAQYWRGVLPEAVTEAADGTLSMDYGTTALVSVVSLAREVKRLKEEIEVLKSEKVKRPTP